MKLVSFRDGTAGVVLGDEVLSLAEVGENIPELVDLPKTILGLIQVGGHAMAVLADACARLAGDAALLTALRSTGALAGRSAKALGVVLPNPPLILAVGMNYKDHLEEMNAPAPPIPYIFAKAQSSLAADGQPIILPEGHDTMVDWEAELAIVIGKPAYRVPVEQALDHVAGYTCANDISARDAVAQTMEVSGLTNVISAWGLNLMGKQFPGFCPIGPVLVTSDELPNPDSLSISCRVNGVTKQDGNTANMVFSSAELISFISGYQRLEPGDVILTGTMAGVGYGRKPKEFLGRGDLVEVEIEGVGILRNTIG